MEIRLSLYYYIGGILSMLNAFKLEDIKTVLINLTGIRLLVIFSLLIESPKSAEEINDYFEKNNYPKDMFSLDTLRNDLNSLRIAGCQITRADKSTNYKYRLISHPFELRVDYEVAKNLSKLYNQTYKYLSIEQLIIIDDLFDIFSNYAADIKTREYLKGISLIKNLNKNLIKDLVHAANKKLVISFTYKAPNIGKQNYDFKLYNLEIRSKKLYINGFNKTYNCNSFLLVSKIVSPITFNINNENVEYKTYNSICELYNTEIMNFEENENDKLIKRENDKIIVELTTDNYFKLKQKILAYGPNCTVISPEYLREDIIKTLKIMREIYKNA